MRSSVALFIALSTLAGLQAALPDEPLPAPALLAQLRAQLDQIRPGAQHKSAGLERPNLTPLVGLSRGQLSSSLGSPDYCDPPSDHGCTRSMHWAYFFYYSQPTARENSGTVEIAIPLRGWAMEIRFAQSGAVDSATWKWQQ